jgi:hypothetical protein
LPPPLLSQHDSFEGSWYSRAYVHIGRGREVGRGEKGREEGGGEEGKEGRRKKGGGGGEGEGRRREGGRERKEGRD